MSLLVVGTVAFDAIETPFAKTDKIIGGAATYICHSASFFSKKTNLVSVVGEDFPNKAINSLKDKGVDVEGLQIKKGRKTFFWSGKYHNNMNSRDTLKTELNVLEDFDPIVPKQYTKSEFLMLGNLMPSVQKRVLEQMQERPKLIVLDTMNFWMDNFMPDLKQALKNTDVLTINDDEARQLSGEYSLLIAAKKILTMGPKYLIIKKGEHGAILFGEDKMFYSPAVMLENVIDPTGAGDTFAGGFTGFLASKKSIGWEEKKQAIFAGAVLASFTCEEFGTKRLAELTKKDLQERVKKLQEISRVEPLLI